MSDEDFDELHLLLDRLILAGQRGQWSLAHLYAKCAEAVLTAAYPAVASSIQKAASRKGSGAELLARISSGVDPEGAAAIALVLAFRRARSPVIDGLTKAFWHEPRFRRAQASLCRRLCRPDCLQPCTDARYAFCLERQE